MFYDKASKEGEMYRSKWMNGSIPEESYDLTFSLISRASQSRDASSRDIIPLTQPKRWPRTSLVCSGLGPPAPFVTDC